jgi:hypothetical protein
MHEEYIESLEEYCAERIEELIPGLYKLVKQHKHLRDSVVGMYSIYIGMCGYYRVQLTFFGGGFNWAALEKSIQYTLYRHQVHGV